MSQETQHKSDMRLALEAACYKRAAPAPAGAPANYGVDLWQFENKRWGGEAWFRDHAGVVVRVTWQGLPPQALGQRLLESIELTPAPPKP